MRSSDPLQRLNLLLRAPEPPFTHGMHAADGPRERERWLEILKLLQRVQKFAAGSQTRNGSTLLEDVRESIGDAVRFIIDGDEVTQDGGMAKQIRVWSSPQSARLAILQEAIALAHSKRHVPFSHLNRPPLIILISERHEDGTEATSETLRRNFLDSWSSTCYGVGEVLTIQGDTPQKIRESLQTLFDGFSPSEFFPVLMVVHISPDSTITSRLTALKRLGEAWNVRLCVDGPALAMLAQSNRPADPQDCAAAADVMLVDPAAWFGFRMCAMVTSHKLWKNPVGEFRDHYSRLLGSSSTMKDYDQTNGLATGPMLNLWTVLSKIGLSNIRNTVGAVTLLAEGLVSALRNSPNIATTYEGVACGVRISYALSREDRLLPKEKSREHASLVNSVTFASLLEESEALFINLGVSSDGTFLQFSPVKLLSVGTFWLPTAEMFAGYAKRLQEVVDKYESCRAGSVAFRSCVAKCREIQFLRSGEDHLELHLSFAAFRIVPTEFGDRWPADESCSGIVRGLTALVSRELTESPHDVSSPQHVVQEETEYARALAEQFNRNPGPLRSSFIYQALSRRQSFPRGYGGNGPLPFDVFLHSDSENHFHDFISIEPRGECKPVHAVNQATVAADLMIACVMRIMESWRAGDITFPLERERFHGPGTEKAAECDASNALDSDIVERADNADILSRLNKQSSDQLDMRDPLEAPGSDVSRPTLSSREEESIERSQDFSSDTDQITSECDRSTSTGNSDQEVAPNPGVLLRTQGNVKEKRSFKIKGLPSSSTIEISSKGTRTDEETNLPNSARAMNKEVSKLVQRTSDLAAARDAIPISQATNETRWFGSWRTKGLSNQNEGDHGESSSSGSEEESSGSSHGQTEEQESSEDSDGDDEQESDSSSSDGDRDDRSSKGDSSSNSNHDSENETDDSNQTTSSESSDASRENLTEIQEEHTYESPNSVQPSPASRLLSWIRPSTVKPYVTKSKQGPRVQGIQGSDSGKSTSTSQSGSDEGWTRQIYDSDDEVERVSSGRTSTLSSHQHVVNSLSNDSEDDSSIGEDRFDEEASHGRDTGRKAAEKSRVNPRNRGYGLGWFTRTGESSKPSASRNAKTTIESETELASSSDSDDETESVESSDTNGGNRRNPADRAAKCHEIYSEDVSSERLYASGESSGTSFAEDSSDVYDSGEGSRSRGTSRPENTETDDDSSRTSEEGGSKNIRNSGSFLNWMLPSWATTPPKLRHPKRRAGGINSRLGIPLSSESSNDSESDESHESQRRARRSKERTPYGRESWSKAASRGTRNRRRARS